jgi:hypothetical protein
MATFPNVSDIIATTIESRSKQNADNLTKNSALLYHLNKRGNVKTFDGGRIIYQELMYNDANTQNAGWFSGYDELDITPNSPITAAQFDIKQASAAVTINGLEEAQNSGTEAMIDLLESRVAVAEGQLQNLVAAGVYADGTGNGGKEVVGLAAAVSTTPTSGTYGGINRATWSFWRNVAFDATTDGGAAATSANIQSYMNRVAVQLVRNSDRPDFIVADNNYYRLFLESLQAIQRITSDGDAAAGFTGIAYNGAGINSTVYLDGGIGGSSPSNRMYFLNTKYLFLRPHARYNFTTRGGDRMSVNQDAKTRLMFWYGNMTCSGAQFQGVLAD